MLCPMPICFCSRNPCFYLSKELCPLAKCRRIAGPQDPQVKERRRMGARKEKPGTELRAGFV